MDLPLTLIIRVAWAEGSTILWLDAVTGAGHAHRILIRLGPTGVPAHDNSMSNAVHATHVNVWQNSEKNDHQWEKALWRHFFNNLWRHFF